MWPRAVGVYVTNRRRSTRFGQSWIAEQFRIFGTRCAIVWARRVLYPLVTSRVAERSARRLCCHVSGSDYPICSSLELLSLYLVLYFPSIWGLKKQMEEEEEFLREQDRFAKEEREAREAQEAF